MSHQGKDARYFRDPSKIDDGGAKAMTGFICTANHPWREGMKVNGQVVHPAAEEGRQRDGYPGGDLVEMSCPHCGHAWAMELPQ